MKLRPSKIRSHYQPCVLLGKRRSHIRFPLSDRFLALRDNAYRKCFDWVSGYKHRPIPPGSNMSVEELRKGGYILNDKQWLSVRRASSWLRLVLT